MGRHFHCLEVCSTVLMCTPPPHTHSAAKFGHTHIVDYLLSNGAVAVASRRFNYTALHWACSQGHNDVVVCLLNRLPALLIIDDSPGETSLHMAARNGHTNIVCNLVAVVTPDQQIRNRDNV